ncbi:hypothetical protein PV375_04775 [Gulosibacter sp. GYB002]
MFTDGHRQHQRRWLPKNSAVCDKQCCAFVPVAKRLCLGEVNKQVHCSLAWVCRQLCCGNERFELIDSDRRWLVPPKHGVNANSLVDAAKFAGFERGASGESSVHVANELGIDSRTGVFKDELGRVAEVVEEFEVCA